MDLRFTPEELAFRDEVRALLARRAARRRSGARWSRAGTSPRTTSSTWQRILNAKGWAVPHWPVEWGGTGLDAGAAIYLPGRDAAGAGAGAAAVRRQHGRPGHHRRSAATAQKKRFLPRIANLDDWWCQGFSEPGAGSDLASLKTAAKRDGDHYVVNGQKIWTTLAQHADWIFCLVRTDPQVKKQEGISFLLIDMRTPGHHRAPDRHHRRRRRGQRGVLRRRAGAGREPRSARRTRAGTMPSSCSATSAPASPASAFPRSASAASASSPRSSTPAGGRSSRTSASATSSRRSRSS